MIIQQQSKFYWLKLKRKIKNGLLHLISWLNEKSLFDNRSWIEVLHELNLFETKEKQSIIDKIGPDQKVVFFVFREIHFLDWFTPIHLALTKEFSGKFCVFYIDFGATLRRVGKGFNWLVYKKNITKRLLESAVSPLCHFSHEEIHLYHNFPRPNLILTSETIRHERFRADHRAYIPHYSVPKAKDTLPRKISFNHVFLPSKPPYTYKEITEHQYHGATIHEVGYPKIQIQSSSIDAPFNTKKKMVIYAPSLDPALILETINKGIISIFQKMSDLDFIIKLHPTLSSKMESIKHLIVQQTTTSQNIKVDTQTNIQHIGADSNALIADFGSIGAEYRLTFFKRVIYLKIPPDFEGGADLLFRDHFADGITNIENLENTIRLVLEKGDLNEGEKEKMTSEVLYAFGRGDMQAAETIDRILSPSKA